MTKNHVKTLITLGWREWVALPNLGIQKIKAKVDTGARTSALHAYFVEPYHKGKEQWVRFGIHPVQNNCDIEIICHSPILEEREVTDSGGHTERRFVIETVITIQQAQHTIEISLTNRDTMKFRMLLGRTALENSYYVNPASSYLSGIPR